jgi:acyl-CoA thioester hydrolase
MGVVHHSRYFEWFECGRTELMRQLGYPYRTMEEEGILLPIVEANSKYLVPAKYDDLIQIQTELREKPRPKVQLFYKVLRLPENELLAKGFTTHVFLNQSGKPIKPIKKFLEVINPYFLAGG